jgi:hypothetical protein
MGESEKVRGVDTGCYGDCVQNWNDHFKGSRQKQVRSEIICSVWKECM